MEDDREIEIRKPDGALLLKYVREEVSADEQSLVENWLAESKEHEDELVQIARIYYARRTKERLESRDPVAAFNKMWSRQKRNAVKTYLRWIPAVAACFIGAIILSVVFINRQNIQLAGPTKPQTITVQANAGMRTSLDLPDGTVVYLNSGSSITYPLPYDADKRTVSLIGEAYFKVAHNPECPFIVGVADDKMHVKVVGTEFNVQAYADEDFVRTTLVEGRVNIEIKTDDGLLSKQMYPSERASYDLISHTLNMEKVNTMYDTGWIEGKLMFKDSPLPEVLKRLSYFYNVNFEIKDAVIQSYCFTGTFVNRQLSQILDYLKISSGIDYQINQVMTDDSEKTMRTKVVLWKKNKE